MKHIRPLPSYIRTKAEALDLARELFPSERDALAELTRRTPPVTLPRYALNQEMADTLRAVFAWLLDDHTRVYKRARFWLFYTMAANLIALLDENAQQKIHDLMRQDMDRDFAARRAAVLMTGDGSGI